MQAAIVRRHSRGPGWRGSEVEFLEQFTREWYECRSYVLGSGSGRVHLASKFPVQMLKRLSDLSPSSTPVPVQWPLIRALQWAAADCDEKHLQTMRIGGP